MNRAPGPGRLFLAFAAIYFIWGSTFLAIKVVVESLPPLLIAGLRATVAGAVLYGFARIRGAPAPNSRHWLAGFCAGALFFLGGHGAIFWGSQYLPSGLVATLDATIPLWVVVFGSVGPTKRVPRRPVVAGVILGLAGMLWLHYPDLASGVVPRVQLIVLAGAASWALGTVWYHERRRPMSSLLSAALPMLTGGLLLLVMSTAIGEPSRASVDAVSARSLFSLGYLIVFGSLTAFSAYSWLLGRVQPTVVTSYAYVNPVVALFLGWLLAGEHISGAAVGPIITILASVILVVAGGIGVPKSARDPAPRCAPRPVDDRHTDLHEREL